MIGINMEPALVNTNVTEENSRFVQNRHNRPIAARFDSVGLEFAYFGEYLCESVGEPIKAIAHFADWERTSERL